LAPQLIDKVFRRKTWQKLVGRARGEARGVKRRAAFYRENRRVNQVLRLARRAHEAATALAAEVHVAHDVLALPAADMVARAVGGLLVCDAVEIPALVGRNPSTQAAWHPTGLAFADHAFESYLRRCDVILTIGWALAAELGRLGPPVHVIPNYRRAQTLAPSPRLRERCGLGPGDALVLVISKITDSLEEVLGGLALLPGHVHLAVMGRLYPEAYRARIEGLIKERRLARRVHLLEPVPYAELGGTAAGADLGLIVRDTGIVNNRVSLPNRIFDYMAAGLPVCSPDIPDIARILRDHDMGVVLDATDPQAWARAIRAALARRQEMHVNALAAARAMVWENLEEPLFAALGRPRSVSFYGFYDLTRNNRTLRMAASLARRGTAVTICTPSAGPAPAVADGVRFHLLSPE